MSAAVHACQIICGLLLIVDSTGLLSTNRRHHPLTAPGRRSRTPSVSNINNNQKVTRLCSLLDAALFSPQPTNTPSATSSRRGSSSNDLPGVSDFERWFESAAIPRGASVDPNIQHAVFGRSGSLLRGLSWMGSTPVFDSKKKRMVATIPSSLVLTAPFQNNAHWDRDLALELWHECRLVQQQQLDQRDDDDDDNSTTHGPAGTSVMAGYCQLLTQNTDLQVHVPPSTAPHCLRHWTEEQKRVLLLCEQSEPGRTLVQLAQQQETAWKQKYDALIAANNNTSSNHQHHYQDHYQDLSWPQFQWAMEAVHSRAFCGVQAAATTTTAALSATILAPVLAAVVAGGYTFLTREQPSELVLAVLAVLAVGPALGSAGQQRDTTAVLLPLMDSANHLDAADSRIEYNPLTQKFELWIGPQCLINEETETSSSSSSDNDDASTQLYVRYGAKSDREWLLNYGFLPGVRVSSSSSVDDQEYRRILAEAFLRRNAHNVMVE